MNPSTSLLSSLVVGLTIGLIPITGILAAITPYLMPKRECFAVTVPDGAQNDPALRQLKRRYLISMIVLTAVLTGVCAGTAFSGNINAMAIAMGVSVVMICIACYGLMLYFRTKVQVLKRERGWQAEGEKTTAVMDLREFPRPLSQRWDLLFIPFALLCLAICVAGYDAIPEEIPMQISLDGHVTTYLHKSPIIACFPAIVVVFVDGLLAFSHWTMLRSKKYADPAAPVQSAWAYAMFLRAQTILIVVGGILCGGVALTLAFSFVGVLSIVQAAVICLVLVFIIAGSSIVVSVVYGQNGSRLIARVSTNSDVLLRDNDKYWKLGIFYVNKEDPSLFLPERFGVGWTMNWGRPAAWAILIGLVVIVVAFIVFVMSFTQGA